MPRCLSEGVDIFLKSVERQGESGHDVRVSRSAPWMARVGGPVIMKTAVSLFIRKFTPGDVTSRRDVPFAVSVRGFFTNSQFKTTSAAHISRGIHADKQSTPWENTEYHSLCRCFESVS